MHTCRNCNRSFPSRLEFELHRDTCVAGDLLCLRCGARFEECEATRDGWHYECPSEDCEGAGREEDIVAVERARVEHS